MFSSRGRLIKFIKLVIGSFFISLLIAIIHFILTVNIFAPLLGLTFVISGFIIYFYNEKSKISESIIELTKYIKLVESHSASVQGDNNRAVQGDNNQAVQGDNNQIVTTTIGRDHNENRNIKNITVGNREVEINPDDIVETFGELKDMLTTSIAQSSNLLEAISIFMEDLSKAFRNSPELKVYFNADNDTSEDELVNSIMKLLLTNDYSQIENMNADGEILNMSKQLVKVENNSENRFKESKSYKGYTIDLLKGNHDRWIYKIKRSDSSFIEDEERGGSYKKETAIKKAEREINKELTKDFTPH